MMGDDWWFHKLNSYHNVRDKMAKEGESPCLSLFVQLIDCAAQAATRTT